VLYRIIGVSDSYDEGAALPCLYRVANVAERHAQRLCKCMHAINF
jgi:hypothetical protein